MSDSHEQRPRMTLRQLLGTSKAADAYISAVAQDSGLILVCGVQPAARRAVIDAAAAHRLVLHGDHVETSPADPDPDWTSSAFIRNALRHNRCVVALHHIDDEPGWKMAVTAAMTDHLVTAGVDALSAAAGTAAVVNTWNCPADEVAFVFAGAIAVRIERRLCATCRRTAPTPANWPDARVPAPDHVCVADLNGCAHCTGGFVGGYLLSEYLPGGHDTATAIRNGATPNELARIVDSTSGGSLVDAAYRAVADGLIDAAILAPHPSPG